MNAMTSYSYDVKGAEPSFNYNMSSRSRPPPETNYGALDRQQRGSPYMRPQPPAGAAPGGGVWQQPMRSTPPRPARGGDESFYLEQSPGGSSPRQPEQWPLSIGSNSPVPPRQSPKQTPPRPRRPDAPGLPLDLALRAAARPPPSDWSSIQQYHHGPGQWTGEGHNFAQQGFRPNIPQRPQPPPQPPGYFHQPPQAAAGVKIQQRAPLGPPPSARKGPASYLPPVDPVYPIVEESDSARSSHQILDYYSQTRDSASALPDHSASHEMNMRSASPLRSNLGAQGEKQDERAQQEFGGPIRQASLGKKSKPTLTIVSRKSSICESAKDMPRETHPNEPNLSKDSGYELPKDDCPSMPRPRPSSELIEPRKDTYGPHDKGFEAGATEASVPAAHSTKMAKDATASDKCFESGTGLLDSSSSESEKDGTLASKSHLSVPQSKERLRFNLPFATELDAHTASKLDDLEKTGSLTPLETSRLRNSTLTTAADGDQRVPRPRLPRLDIDAVREAEARGSLTSLPDLISRATRLAANLDRGKTASRLGVGWFTNPEGEKRGSARSTGCRSAGTISDILAAFPPPGRETPLSDDRRDATWPKNSRRGSHLPSESDAGDDRTPRKRKCCGMPVWLLIVLLIFLFLLVAAAVVIPVMLLIVIPGQEESGHNGVHSAASAQIDSLASCRPALSCANGGTNILGTDGMCRCVCVGGFTGTSCEKQGSSAACTTVAVGVTKNATLGTDVARLLSDVRPNFSIPLDAESISGLLSSSNLDCQEQNDLVTFQDAGLSKDDIDVGSSETPEDMSVSSASASDNDNDYDGKLALAGTTVLYVFQLSGEIGEAREAQQDLQQALDTGATGGAIDLGSGSSLDLEKGVLHLRNGTTIGGGDISR